MAAFILGGFAALGTAASTGFTEISGGGYARQPLLLVPVDADVMINQGGMTFGPDTSTAWGAITTVGVFDAAAGGNLLLFWPLSQPPYGASSGTVTFAAGALLLHLERVQAAAADSIPTTFPRQP